MASRDGDRRDGDLGERIAAAKKSLEPKKSGAFAEKYNAISLAWRMTLELVVGAGIGFAIGYGLDGLLGTKPFLLIVFLLLGFAAGVRTVMATAQEASRARGDEANAADDRGRDDA